MILSRIMSISKILTDFCASKQNKNKKHFGRYSLQCFSSKKILEEHKEVYLKISGEQSVKLRDETRGFS